MTHPSYADLTDYATLWVCTGHDEYNEPILAAPVEISCRWTWIRQDAAGPQGTKLMLDAQVAVDRRVPADSLMWLGRLTDIPGTTFSGQENPLMQVKTFSEAADPKGRIYRRELGLARFKDKLPV